MVESARVAELERENQDLQHRLVESYQWASLGRLIAGIVHEINTPIGSIVSNNEVSGRSLTTLREKVAELAEAKEPPSPRILKILETLSSLSDVDKIACDRILGVVRGVKTFVRKEGEDKRRADLLDLLSSMSKLSNCEFRRRVHMVMELQPLPEVECYPEKLTQVFLNLMVNAAQSIEGEGTVTLRSRQDGDYVVLSITDTGKGIPPELQSKIFEQGFTTKPIGVGTGLGLAISRQIVVDLHHGELSFQSEPGKGTTFEIRLPINQPKQPQ